MPLVLAQVESAFQLEMTEEEVLRLVAHMELDGPRSGREVETSRIIWWGSGSNIGYHALTAAPPDVYRHLFPSAAKAAIEVFEKGPSAAEDGFLIEPLMSPLTDYECEFRKAAAIDWVLSPAEREAVIAVLQLIAMRKEWEEEGHLAERALEDYWLA